MSGWLSSSFTEFTGQLSSLAHLAETSGDDGMFGNKVSKSNGARGINIAVSGLSEGSTGYEQVCLHAIDHYLFRANLGSCRILEFQISEFCILILYLGMRRT